MCWTEPRWMPTVWSRRAALSSVALPPWAMWRASSTARWVKKTSLLFLCQPLSLQQQLHKYWWSPVAVYLLVALYVSKAAGSSSGYGVSWREKDILTSLFYFPSSHPGDYLVTIEEKNSATYLRAYTNWRYQVLTDQRSFLTLYHKCYET